VRLRDTSNICEINSLCLISSLRSGISDSEGQKMRKIILGGWQSANDFAIRQSNIPSCGEEWRNKGRGRAGEVRLRGL